MLFTNKQCRTVSTALTVTRSEPDV